MKNIQKLMALNSFGHTLNNVIKLTEKELSNI